MGDLVQVFSIGYFTGALTFVFLAINKPSGLTGRPLFLINILGLHDAFDQSNLIVTVDNLEILGQFGLGPMHAQQSMSQAVKGADPHGTSRHIEQRLGTGAQLRRRLVGKRHRKDAMRGNPLHIDQPRNTMHQHTGLAAASTRYHQRIGKGRRYGVALGFVESIKDMRDVQGQPCLCYKGRILPERDVWC